MRSQSSHLIRAVWPHTVDVERASRSSAPHMASQQVREEHRHVVGGSVCNPQATKGRDHDVARRHRADVA